MEELDLLKKNWKKNENSFEQISEKDLYKMLHHKSSSIVKLILIISIAEVLLWSGISLCFNGDEFYKNHLHRDEIIEYMNVFSYFNYAVVFVFIYLFYKNYERISTMTSTKQLMKDILKTRKTVHYYVYYNLIMIVLSSIVGVFMAFTLNPEVIALKEKLTSPKAIIITIGVFMLLTLAFFGLFWLFYRLLYGTLLRKLYANYKELKKIDL